MLKIFIDHLIKSTKMGLLLIEAIDKIIFGGD